MAEAARARRPRKERTENAAKRRRQLVEATLRSVVRHGLSRTTLATVAEQAGLSQGVAVFYFKTKDGLLVEALRHLYDQYHTLSMSALEAAGDDPVKQVTALVRADFDPSVCNAEALAVWHAFWGEANARPLYAEVAAKGDAERTAEMQAACERLLAAIGRDPAMGATVAEIVDAAIDGLWLQIYLTSDMTGLDRKQRLIGEALACHFPEVADRIRAEMGMGT